ncbi:MAG: alpha-hydroxy-acid oxidizing protein [Candidatus Hydrogenedentes bacterium]|nr:alpha-hydroxy-acid oxidizing protein [Candidatus Hydrogenedentota bacterium]
MSSTHYGDYQIGLYMQGLVGLKPELPLIAEELEALAKAKLDPRAYWYVAGGAGHENTVRANRQAFDRWQIVPRMLRDVSERNYSTTVLHTEMRAPLLLAPVGVQEIIHPEAERAVARAARAMGIPMILSTLSSTPLEEVAELLGNTPRWFQLYWPGERDFTKSLLQRAEAAGYEAIVVTLDTKLMGWREHDLQEAYLPFLEGKGIANYTSDPVFRASLEEPPEANPQGAVARWAQLYADPSQTWEDLVFLQDHTSLPIILKGILHPDDAATAVFRGVQGIIVSNHGGRQVDGALGALDALPAVVDAVGGRVPVLFDSGIRHGADMVKALALGADAVLLGRPYIYGLAAAGESGVHQVIQRLLAEFDVTMALSGLCRLSELDRGVLQPAPR